MDEMCTSQTLRQTRIAIWVILMCVWRPGAAVAQTQVDLSRQTRAVDLSGLGPTKPVQTGTTLPATCGVGQLFFKTNATPGANLYACVATNSWVVASGAGGGGGGEVTSSGASVGGNLTAFLDQTGDVLVDSGVSGSQAVIMTQALYQSGAPLDCQGQVGDTGSVMTCLLTPTLIAYTLHMPLRLTPRVANDGAFTLNIDGLGAKAVRSGDCATEPEPGSFQADQTYLLTYDGTVFCEVNGGGMKPSAPYFRLGAGTYLNFAFRAQLPPTGGWTAVNSSGATFLTTGMGGAVRLQTPSSRSGEALNLQVREVGGTTTLTAVLNSAGLGQGADFGACGIGVYNSSSQASYVLMQQLRASSAPLFEAGYSSPTAQTFLGNTVSAGTGNIVYLRVEIVGSNIVASYSPTGGPNSWVPINSRALGSSGMPESVDRWVFLGEAAVNSPAYCQLLSWETI